ncbi:hypothetical protein HHK36_006201 [Tetracentron sinense]|uniref:BHLH domain-containing protein n=1 Tax=Tetracentron sinense TaxID=13715 RepID=A0A834ZP26_TETSI|nr:hypothetical protein HHK36_006201 [Tetracentron sinense]
MNQGVLQRLPVQQMMAGNPNWWNNMGQPLQQPSPSSHFPKFTPTASSLPFSSCNDNQDLPESWSQLLLDGLVGEEERYGVSQVKKLESWEDKVLYPSSSVPVVDVNQEVSESGYVHGHGDEEFQAARPPWSQMMPSSSPSSCVTSFSCNMLDFSNSKGDGRRQQPDQSSEVKKEKLGDRITALHQLVSPFGKTDTASVLLEVIGYIRFLQSQIEALSSPYLGSGSGNMMQQQPVQGERNCIFPEDPGQDAHDEPKDLRSRGLCLVPVSCTVLQVGSDNGADYWAPTLGSSFR